MVCFTGLIIFHKNETSPHKDFNFYVNKPSGNSGKLLPFFCIFTLQLTTNLAKLENWQRKKLCNSAFEDNDLIDSYHRDLGICKNFFKKSGVAMPNEKKLNYARSVGVNRSESLGATTRVINRASKHNKVARIDMSCISLATKKTMYTGSSNFSEPVYEPW